MDKITTGSDALDYMLEGGYEKDVITTIYGPAGSGKTNLCLLCLAHNSDKKVIYIDTESGFSTERLKQLTPDYEKILKNVIILRPTDFSEQKKVFEKLKSIVSDKISLIIVDSIAMLYRLEIAMSKEAIKTNRELSVQLAGLIQIARKFKVPVLLTNQVYADMETKDAVKVVGGDTLRYACKCLIEIQKENGIRKAIIQKHRSLPEGREVKFKIVDEGIREIK